MTGKTPASIGVAHSNQWIWVVEKINETALVPPFPFCTSGVHKVYTILDEPQIPWSKTFNSPQNPWVTALEIACSNAWAGGATSIENAASGITRAIYKSGKFEYNQQNGESVYTDEIGRKFDLTSWIARINGDNTKDVRVNCWDCANGVVSLSNVLGCDLWNQWMGLNFECNEIRLISNKSWAKPPFPNNQFDFHRVGWRGSEDTTGRVFDACLKVNGGSNPSGGGNQLEGLIPVNMLFGTGTTSEEYKFQLVAPGSYNNCNLTHAGARTQVRDPIR
jgi:hypothetical protein